MSVRREEERKRGREIDRRSVRSIVTVRYEYSGTVRSRSRILAFTRSRVPASSSRRCLGARSIDRSIE